MLLTADNSLIISSGSKGNAVIHDCVLIDCGISSKELQPHIHKKSLKYIITFLVEYLEKRIYTVHQTSLLEYQLGIKQYIDE